MNNAVPHSHFLSVASPFPVNLIILGDCTYVKVQWKAILVVQGLLCFSTTQCYVRPPPQRLIASCSHWSYGGRCFFPNQFLFCSFSSQNSVGAFCPLSESSQRKNKVFQNLNICNMTLKLTFGKSPNFTNQRFRSSSLGSLSFDFKRNMFFWASIWVSCLMHIFWLRIHWIYKHNWHLLSPELVRANSAALTTPKWNQSDIPQNNIHVAHDCIL